MVNPFKFLRFYHKSIIVLLVPVLLTPVLLIDGGSKAARCFYVVLWMAFYWVFEVMPLGVTGMMPIFLFPVLEILDSRTTCCSYVNETSFMFFGGLALAAALEYSNLHTRIALNFIKTVGCSAKRLHISLCFVTILISWWVINTATTAMMLPIVNAICYQLDTQDLYKTYLPQVENTPGFEEDRRKPDRYTVCLYLSIAFSSTIGGIGTVVGSGTNLIFKAIFEVRFPDDPEGISFIKWFAIGAPNTVLLAILMIVWMQFLFMGLFRPNSDDFKAVNFGARGEEFAKKAIEDEINKLGKLSFHEIMVSLLFLLTVSLWVFRSPQFVAGWADLKPGKMGDSVPITTVIFLLFLIPAVPNFIYFCSSDEAKRPEAPSPGCVTWKALNAKMAWGLFFLLGGGFAIAQAARETGMSALIANWLGFVKYINKYAVMVILSVIATVLTNTVSSNITVCNIIMPILADLSIVSKFYF